MPKVNDLTGQRFGKLIAIRKDGHLGKKVAWLCKCDCGNYKRITADRLTMGQTKSCGCLHSEIAKNRLITHGQTHTKLYKVWEAMKRRCDSPKCDHYPLYGGRGIHYIPEWKKFEPFYHWALSAGYKDGLSIDRINVNGNYCPENCQWIPLKQQAYNKTTSKFVTLSGKTLTISEWCERLKLPYELVYQRIVKLGWNPEKAFKAAS